MTGVTIVKPIWGGRANLAEFKSDGPLALLSLRWYNPSAHQWSVDFVTPGVGMLGTPAVGEFKNGRGDFYDQEPINGKSILVRFSVWKITADTAQSEQDFRTMAARLGRSIGSIGTRGMESRQTASSARGPSRSIDRGATKYDSVTLGLHVALAAGFVEQLL
jgi:hypothetical protein